MRTVELLADDGLDRAVRAAWRRLDQVGLPSLAQHRHPTNRPHLTLASAEPWPAAAPAALAEALRALPIGVRLDRLVFFGGRAGVLAWLVDGGDVLRELQAQVWSALDPGPLDPGGRNPQFEPGAWTPHVSLARRLRPDQAPLAAVALGGIVAAGTLDGARSYDSANRTVVPLP
jgi:2'-5' RNA ligase